MTQFFSSLALRPLTPKNRRVVAPMSPDRARHGAANDCHLAHCGRLAPGGSDDSDGPKQSGRAIRNKKRAQSPREGA